MPRLFRQFLNVLVFAFTAFCLTAPAAAWDAHGISHMSTPVAVDAHHHHDDESSDIVEAEPEHDEGDEGGGHDHMPSVSANSVAMTSSSPALSPPSTSTVAPARATESSPVAILTSPESRPPRLV